MRGFTKKNNIKAALIICMIFLVVVISGYKINNDLKPVMLSYCDYECRVIAIETINTVVKQRFGDEINYSDIMSIKNDNEGNVSMIQANTAILNKVSSQMSIDIQDQLKERGEGGVQIQLPLGVLFKNDFFSYMGPKFSFKMIPAGLAIVKYRSEFDAAGINQTRHTVYFDISSDMYVLIPLGKDKITVETSIPVAESIIVGKVPETYVGLNGTYDLITPGNEEKPNK